MKVGLIDTVGLTLDEYDIPYQLTGDHLVDGTCLDRLMPCADQSTYLTDMKVLNLDGISGVYGNFGRNQIGIMVWNYKNWPGPELRAWLSKEYVYGK